MIRKISAILCQFITLSDILSVIFLLYLKRCSNNNKKILKAEETSVAVILDFVVLYCS